MQAVRRDYDTCDEAKKHCKAIAERQCEKLCDGDDDVCVEAKKECEACKQCDEKEGGCDEAKKKHAKPSKILQHSNYAGVT